VIILLTVFPPFAHLWRVKETKGRKNPSLAKRSEGRFGDTYQFIFETFSISFLSNDNSATRR
jgi:hypothetical protein